MRRSFGILLVAVFAFALVVPAVPAGATSSTYTQPNWFQWDTSHLHVLILPTIHGQLVNGNGALGGSTASPVNELSPTENSYMTAVENAIRDWKKAIATYGAGWLQSNLTIDWKVVGRDNVTTADIQNANVIVTFGETTTEILGVTFNTQPCLINDSKQFIESYTYEDMYNVSGHEFGHCLGLDHTFGSPSDDAVVSANIIHATYEENISGANNPLHCMANLNISGVQNSFAGTLGQPGAGAGVTIPASTYQRIDCSSSQYHAPALLPGIAQYALPKTVTGVNAQSRSQGGYGVVTPPVAGLAPFVCHFQASGLTAA